MLATSLLMAQVLAERYTRTVLQTVVIIVGVAIFVTALAVIFTWIGAGLPDGTTSG